MRSSVSAGSRTSQRMAFSQKRWKARPSSPSPAARNPQCQARVGEQRQRAPLAGVARHQHRRRLAVAPLERRVRQQRGRAGLARGTRLMPSSGGSLAQRSSFSRGSSSSEVTGWVRPSGVSLRLEASVVRSASFAPSSAGGDGRQLDRQHVAQRGRAVAAAGERQVAADHGDGAALLDVVAHAGQERLDAVGGEVEVLEDHQIERAQLLLEDLVGRETGSATARRGSRAARRSRCAG